MGRMARPLLKALGLCGSERLRMGQPGDAGDQGGQGVQQFHRRADDQRAGQPGQEVGERWRSR